MRRFFFCCAVSLILLSPVVLVHADSPAPEYDYILEVGDAGEYIFVMLAVPDDETAYGQGGWSEDEEIRAKYEKSGLYRSGETEEAIWTVDWYAFGVDITSDGKHLVRWGPWAFTPNYDEIALEFYENGGLLRSYRVSDLVAEPQRLPHTVSHYFWDAEAEFNGEKRELYLKTENGKEYLFDVTTGDIIRESKPVTAQAILIVIGAVVVLGLVLGYFIRQKTKAS